MENGALSQGEGKDPSGFLSEIIGNSVTVKLNSGVVYKGRGLPPRLAVLLCFLLLWRELTAWEFQWPPSLTCPIGELQSVDGYMNIALEKTEEYVGGVKKRSYGDAFVRGNNGKMHPTLRRVYSPLTCCRSHVHLCRLIAAALACEDSLAAVHHSRGRMGIRDSNQEDAASLPQ